MKFEYPISIEKNSDLNLGHNNTVGYFPIGRIFNWHGGLHVDERQYSPIKAIADGVVIAYRIASKALDCEGMQFSNSFVLIKHKYHSPQGRELYFYSLYNHLMTFDELEAQKKVPDIFAETKYEVRGERIKGLNLRSASDYNDKIVVPYGMKVETDPQITAASANLPAWPQSKKTKQYVKTSYKDLFSKEVYDNRYMYIDKGRTPKVDDGGRQVRTKEDVSMDRGENVRSADAHGTIKLVVPNGTQVLVDGFLDDSKSYYRVRSLDGKTYGEDLKIYAKSLEESDEKALTLLDEDCDKIITGEECDIEVQGGNIIGFVGQNGFTNSENYRAAHVEIFTDDDTLSSFLKGVEGDKDDIEETQHFTRVAKGALLTLKYPTAFLKDDEIRVLDFPDGEDEKYCQICLHKQTRDVNQDLLEYILGSQKKNDDGDVIAAQYKPDNLKELNTIFNDTLGENSIIDWVESLESENEKRRRRVSHTLTSDTLPLWVAKSELGLSTRPQNPVTLNSDLQALYYKKPVDDEIEFTLEKEVIEKTSELETVKPSGSDYTWIKILSHKVEQTEFGTKSYKEIEGYIKSDNSCVSKLSAFDWEAFGFKMFKNQETTFVYNNTIEDITKDNAPAFLQSLWEHIDEDGSGTLSRIELRNALRDRFTQQRLSKMICYHQSEWGVDVDALKSEVEVLLDEGIKKEKDEEKKQKLENKKGQILSTLETKVKTYNFWGNIKEPVVTIKKTDENTTRQSMPMEFKLQKSGESILKTFGSIFPFLKEKNIKTLDLPEIPDIEVEYKKLPAQPKFWHFNPVAFVGQMRRIQPNCFCNKDISVKAFEAIFGKGPWFTGKLGIVDMEKDYPDVYNISTQKFVDALNAAMNKYEIHSCLQKAHFLAQCYHESGYFRSTAEYGDGSDYDPGSHKALHYSYESYCAYLKKYSSNSNDNYTNQEESINGQFEKYKAAYETYDKASESERLTDEYKALKEMHDEYPAFKTAKQKFDSIYERSYHYSSTYTSYQNWLHSKDRYDKCISYKNTNNGDGKKYRGRGLMQLTWKSNYLAYKEYSGIDCVNNPKFISSSIKNACDSAGWHWLINSVWNFGKKRVNEYANSDDLLYSTIAVNGGFNGLDDRYEKTQRCLDSFGCKKCSNFRGLDLGSYSYETSQLSKTNYGKKNKVKIIKGLNNAKGKYDKKKE